MMSMLPTLEMRRLARKRTCANGRMRMSQRTARHSCVHTMESA